MGRKRERFQWVVDRLEDWGRWTAKNVEGLGFAGRTQEGRLMDEGPVGSKTNYRDYSPVLEYAHKEHETHRAVASLPRDWYWMVCSLYAEGKEPAQVAGQLGRSVSWVRQTHTLVLTYLAAKIPEEERAG